MNNIFIIEGDLTKANVDAIVNATNTKMMGEGGVNGAIHRAAGPSLRDECLKVKLVNGIRCPVGEARITSAGNLPSKYVIHTVGPIYIQVANPEELLESAYINSLRLAIKNGCQTVAFPAISCGAYSYPHQEAAKIALEVCSRDEFKTLQIYFYLVSNQMVDIWSGVKNSMYEEYTDQNLGWHIKINRTKDHVWYVYTNIENGETIEGVSLVSMFKLPSKTIQEHIEKQNRIKEERRAGVTGTQISRRILEMVGELHKIGYESLYIDPTMAPSGCYWRYEIGVIVEGHWPNRVRDIDKRETRSIYGSIGGGYDEEIPWGKPSDSLQEFVNGFLATYPHILERARKPNGPYVEWYQEMLQTTAPEGLLIFCSDCGPCYEYAYTWGEPEGFRMPLPPGFVGGDA